MTDTPGAAFEAGLSHIRSAPRHEGTIVQIVARPAPKERRRLSRAVLDPDEGLVGDGWRDRPSRSTPDGAPDPGKQLTLMSARVAALVAGEPERWGLAGDQLYVDLDLSTGHLPVGSRLAVGSATVEITETPHLGCATFGPASAPTRCGS